METPPPLRKTRQPDQVKEQRRTIQDGVFAAIKVGKKELRTKGEGDDDEFEQNDDEASTVNASDENNESPIMFGQSVEALEREKENRHWVPPEPASTIKHPFRLAHPLATLNSQLGDVNRADSKGESESLPVKNTFIHFVNPRSPLRTSKSRVCLTPKSEPRNFQPRESIDPVADDLLIALRVPLCLSDALCIEEGSVYSADATSSLKVGLPVLRISEHLPSDVSPCMISQFAPMLMHITDGMGVGPSVVSTWQFQPRQLIFSPIADDLAWRFD